MQTSSVPPANVAAGVTVGSTANAEAATAQPRVAPETLRLFPHSKRQLRINLYMLLMVVDILSIFGCFAFGALVRFGDLRELTWLRMSLAVTPLFIGIALHNGAYSLPALRSPTTGAARAVGALLTSFALLFVISYFLKAEQDVSRLSVAVAVFATVGSVAMLRKVIGEWVQKTFCGQLTASLIITDESYIAASPDCIMIDALTAGLKPEARNPLALQRFAKLVEGADRVVIACRREACSSWAMLLKGSNVRGEILADEVQSVGAVGVDRLGSRTTLVVSSGPLTGQQRAMKRALDLALTIPILILILPVLIGTIIAIRLDSNGPVLFRQSRVGYGNRLFDVFKFRSMAVETADPMGAQSTLREDTRITRVGRFIRRTSLDELPQLFNVLNGTMSLVGPRPHALGSLAGQVLFWEVDDRYSHRHVLKPGITGLAQIRGFRGSTNHVDDLSRRLQADLEYIAGWSIWRDLLIILKTLRVMVHQNAY
ncbi:MAG: exopolysaccharide biosynthesis polyprenyl glycosylphosphotransferase [Sphingomicrobium sp.]